MATTKSTASLAFVLLFLIASCASKDDGGSSTGPAGQEGIHTYCTAACDKEKSCGPDVSGPDTSTCATECDAKLKTDRLQLVRADTVAAITQCASSLDCAALATHGDFVEALAQCQADAIKAITPSAAVQSLCTKLNAAEAACMQSMSETCTDDFKPYNDGTLGTVSACFDKACGEVQACVEAALTP